MAQQVDLLLYKSIDNDKLKQHIKKHGKEWFRRGWVMSADWSQTRLGDFVELKRGYDLPQKDRKEGVVPVISSAGESGSHDVAKVKAPGVITGRYGTIGSVNYIERDYWPLNTTLYVKDFKGNDPLFVYYFLKIINYLDYSDKAAVPGINRNHLHTAEIRVPTDVAHQRSLALHLWNLDQKIELNRQINQTLEEMAQAIFKSWFVDFEPVKAKIEAKANGQNPERAAMCAIRGKTDAELDQLPPDQFAQLRATAALFPDELIDSELGPIPKGWEYSTIGKEVDVVGGGTPSTKNPDFWDNGTFHWTTPKDLSGKQDKILLNTERKITQAGIGKISSGLLPIGTVLLSSRAPVGYLALAKVPVAVNQGYIAMKCTKKLPSVYVLQWANFVMDDIKQRASGTTFAEISKKNFRIIPVLVPTEDVLNLYRQKVNCLYDKITESISEITTLADLRNTLLPKLLSGEISVGSAQSTIEEAV
jgi:type I restriction enzyme S subunit